jgi:hypothetical protein
VQTTNRQAELQSILSESPLLAPILQNWDRIALPEAWLVAGAVAQTVWNHAFGFTPDYGINDIDIIYFDGDDLSENAETRHSDRIRAIFSDVPARIDVKNQARVHIWHEGKFGYPIKPYISVAEAIATFPTTATAIGVRPSGNELDLCGGWACGMDAETSSA